MTSKVIDVPSKQDVEKMVDRDRHSIDKNIQDLFSLINKINTDIERLKDGIGSNNDKIGTNNEKIWAQIALIQIEIERAKLWRDLYNQDLQELKKKRVGEIQAPTLTPSSEPTELGWETF